MKSIKDLKEELLGFEAEITKYTGLELGRIGRTVESEELETHPFSDSVRDYVTGIYLNGGGDAIVTCSFEDIDEKILYAFSTDFEIEPYGLILLL